MTPRKQRGRIVCWMWLLSKNTHTVSSHSPRIAASKAGNSIESGSGLSRKEIEEAAATYAKSKACLGIYGMGVTQQTQGVQNVQMICNLLLLRGNIGKPGGNILPVRGHSNVQGQRTVGITEKPELAPLDEIERQFGFSPPRDKGMDAAETGEAVLAGELHAFLGLGGNFVRAIPDTVIMEEAWRKIPLTVQISTKLNRSHVIHGKISYILPCLGRTEIDRQASGPQAVTMEDSTAFFHGSKGYAEPAGPSCFIGAKDRRRDRKGDAIRES